MAKIKFGRSETWKDRLGRHTYVTVFRDQQQIGTIGADEIMMAMRYCFEPAKNVGGEVIDLGYNLNEAKRRYKELAEKS